MKVEEKKNSHAPGQNKSCYYISINCSVSVVQSHGLKDTELGFRGWPSSVICRDDWLVEQEQSNDSDGSNDSKNCQVNDHFLRARYWALPALYLLLLTKSQRGNAIVISISKMGKLSSGKREGLTRTQGFLTLHPVLSTTMIVPNDYRFPICSKNFSLVHQLLSRSTCFLLEGKGLLYAVFNCICTEMSDFLLWFLKRELRSLRSNVNE